MSLFTCDQEYNLCQQFKYDKRYDLYLQLEYYQQLERNHQYYLQQQLEHNKLCNRNYEQKYEQLECDQKYEQLECDKEINKKCEKKVLKLHKHQKCIICKKRSPIYGLLNTKQRLYCCKCNNRRYDTINMVVKRCLTCDKIAIYGYPDTKKREYCTTCKKTGMVSFRKRYKNSSKKS